ncbi:hypothetical protein [Catenuloplanes japonicus]|nr:hypothetical protein [Catenuloplanes japonicus]
MTQPIPPDFVAPEIQPAKPAPAGSTGSPPPAAPSPVPATR